MHGENPFRKTNTARFKNNDYSKRDPINFNTESSINSCEIYKFGLRQNKDKYFECLNKQINKYNKHNEIKNNICKTQRVKYIKCL